MWLKLLGFAKAFSKRISTFVLMINTIFMDLRSFMAVLGVIIAMFGHAFYLSLSRGLNAETHDEYRNLPRTAATLYTVSCVYRLV